MIYKKKAGVIVLYCLSLSFAALSQNEVLIDGPNTTQNAYEGNSFKYVNEVILKPGFAVNASTHGNWYVKPYSYSPANSPNDLYKNFVRTEKILKTGVTDANQISSLSPSNKSSLYEYVDDIGRPAQKVNVRNSPAMKDVVHFHRYDDWSRQPMEYMQYTFNEFDKWGSYREEAMNEQLDFYSNSLHVINDQEPFKVNSFDDSPLNQVKQVYGPGLLWHLEHGNRSFKSKLSANPPVDVVRQWTYNGTGYPQTLSNWPKNTILISEIIDEQNQVKRSYKNFRDQLILEKSGSGATWHETYYIYDLVGNLVFVFPPEAVARLDTDYLPIGADKQTFLNRWCYQYQYDDYQRMTGKRVPGKSDWTYMIYDRWDRIVLTQDPNQRTINQWTFTKYDILNRIILTGFTSGVKATLITMAANSAMRFESRSSNSVGYSNVTFPTHTENDLLTITYFDDYSFLNYNNWDAEVPVSNYSFISEPGFSQAEDVFYTVKGHATGAKVRVINQNKWLNSVRYYDSKYREIQTTAENNLGGIERTTSKYDFVGTILKTLHFHSTPSNSISLLTEFEYDHAGRILRVYKTLDNLRILVSSNKYNELGELIEKNSHSTDEGETFLQSIDYRYNIRGWLTHINNSTLTNDGNNNDDTNDLFGMDLVYNQELINVNGNTTPVYNGNISAIRWKWNNLIDSSPEKIFKYQYDTWNRLEQAYFAAKNGAQWNSTLGGYNEAMTYDNNGNILSLNRSGKLGASNTTLDNLVYKYTGNQLTNVHDNSPYWNANEKNPDYGFVEIFHDVNLTEYQYDNNSNLTADLNKGIESITYNHLNMPERIELENDRVIEYTYDAAGNKLRKILRIGSSEIFITDYIGGIHYVNNQLAFLQTDDGRVVKRNNGFDFEYFLRDHQGNTRVVFGSQRESKTYIATLEPEFNTKETTDFKNITRGTGHNHTSKSHELLAPQYSAILNGGVGPAKMITIKQGDRLYLQAFARYTGTVSSSKIATTVLATAVTNAFQVFPVGETQVAHDALNGGVLTSPVGENASAPKAYLCYFLFSSNYSLLQFGYYTISTAASLQFEKLNLGLTISLPNGITDGFVYAYVANETIGTSVYFDDIKIIHEKTTTGLQVLQAFDYYPFGLTINPLSYEKEMMDQQLVKNNYKYQNQELQSEFDLCWYQYKYRMHDPAIGRFGGIDPLAEKYYYNSTYAFSENRLTDGVELEGLEFYEIMKYWSPIAFNFNFSSGSLSQGVGWEVSIGAPKSWPFSYRKNFGGMFYSKDPIQGKSFNETRESTETSFFGVVSTQSTNYNSPDMPQTTGMITLGNALMNIKYENDWQPEAAIRLLDPFGFHPKFGGDGGDRWRSAALQANVGILNAGFNLATGDPGLNSETRAKEEINGQFFYVPSFLADPDNYRLGAAYVGLGPIKIGSDSEGFRDLIQNRIVHKLQKVPYFSVLDKQPRIIMQISTETGTLWGR